MELQPRSIGILPGAGNPLGSTLLLKNIVLECQHKYNSLRSYEFPAIHFYSFPYSEMMLSNNTKTVPSREVSHCIQQYKYLDVEIVVIPCFTLGSYLDFRNYGVELIEPISVLRPFLEKKNITDPLILCTERTRGSKYCDKHFKCHYPNREIQEQVNLSIEKALAGEQVDMKPIFDLLPDEHIVGGCSVLNEHIRHLQDSRFINTNKLLVDHVVLRSYEGGKK